MATIKKSRYRRVNIDGKSLFRTQTRPMGAVALLPGTFAVIDAATDTWVKAAANAKGRVYVIGAAEHQGLGIRDAVPVGDSAVGNYVEEGREFAVLCPAGTFAVDTPVAINAGGLGVPGTDANCIGYSQDAVTIGAGDTDFVRVRMRNGATVA